MRRAIVPLALVLALVTGAVLHATQVVVLAPAVVPSPDSEARAHAALVRRFYVAANEVLATGDTAALDDVLDADFVDHAARPGLLPDRQGLFRSLQSLHAVAPAFRLEVLDVVVQNDRVAAMVGTAGGEGAVFLGLPVPAAALWASTDLFRVEAGRIVARWGDPTGLAFFDPLLTVGVSIEEPADKVITLERWTYAPGATETRAGDLGFVVLLGEAGALTVQVIPGAYGARADGDGKQGPDGRRLAATPEPPKVLRPGDAVVVPQDGRIAIRNDGPVPAVALAVVATLPAPPTGSVMEAVGPPSRIEHAILADGSVRRLPTGEATVAIGRIALAPGTGLPSHTVGIAELASVETGTLALADSGRAWVTSLPNAAPRDSNVGPVPTRGGVRVDRGNVVGYHNAGDDQLTLLLVTVIPIPVDPDTTPGNPPTAQTGT